MTNCLIDIQVETIVRMIALLCIGRQKAHLCCVLVSEVHFTQLTNFKATKYMEILLLSVWNFHLPTVWILFFKRAKGLFARINISLSENSLKIGFGTVCNEHKRGKLPCVTYFGRCHAVDSFIANCFWEERQRAVKLSSHKIRLRWIETTAKVF